MWQTVQVITGWWRGFDAPPSKVDWKKFKICLCNCCLKAMPIAVPKKWVGVEMICAACDSNDVACMTLNQIWRFKL